MNKNFVTFLLLLTGCCTLICAASQMDISLKDAELPKNAELPTIGNIEEGLDVDKRKTTTTSTTTTTTTTKRPTTTTTTTKAPEPVPDTTTTTSTTTTTTTTTKAPDTTTKAPLTTTMAPNTTTPAPAPQPYPEPSIGQWNSSCIMIKLAAQLNFTYLTKDNKNATALYNLPTDAKVQDAANCESNTTQMLQLNWGPAEAQSSLIIQFDMKNKTAQMTMIRFVLALTADRFPDAKENETIQLLHRGFDFSAPAKMSYHCTRSQKFNLTETIVDKTIMGTLTVHDVQVEAFRTGNSTTGFSTVHDCDSAETSDIVPIAVGIALAGLITIVLVAYLCARRRSTSRGYMSF